MIRLRRGGNNTFRVVVAPRTAKRQGRHHEIVGQYDAIHKTVSLDQERIDYWLSKGAQASDTVLELIQRQKLSPEKLAKKLADRKAYKAKRSAKKEVSAE